MTPVASLPLSRIPTDNADHGGGRRVPYETPIPAGRAAEPDTGPARPSDRSPISPSAPSSPRQRPQELVDLRYSAPFSPLARENNSHSRRGVPV